MSGQASGGGGSTGAAPAAPTLVCPRHKVETPLTCSSCGVPICPQCYVRTAVGLRCPKCAEGVKVKLRGGPRWTVVAPALAVLMLLVVLALRAVSSGDGAEPPVSDEEVAQPADGAARGYKLVSRPEQGFALEVPVDWLPAADDSPTTASYSKRRATDGALRVSVSPGTGSLDDRVTRLTGELQAQGGQDLAQSPAQVGGQPAILLTYRFPSSPTPGAVLANHYSYLVTHGGRSYSVQLSTADPGANESVFAYIASSFRFL